MITEKDSNEFKLAIIKILHLGGTKGLALILEDESKVRGYNILQDFVGETKELHITEQDYPEQTKRFREILDEMYQVHLDKNRDYSPANILATGIVGLGTRIWDKTARICSLLGWNLLTGEFSSERKSINDESIEDNLKDLAIYAIIARIFRENKWGK